MDSSVTCRLYQHLLQVQGWMEARNSSKFLVWMQTPTVPGPCQWSLHVHPPPTLFHDCPDVPWACPELWCFQWIWCLHFIPDEESLKGGVSMAGHLLNLWPGHAAPLLSAFVLAEYWCCKRLADLNTFLNRYFMQFQIFLMQSVQKLWKHVGPFEMLHNSVSTSCMPAFPLGENCCKVSQQVV